MKRILTSALLLAYTCLFGQNNLLLPVKVDGKWGFINDKAEVVIQPVYNHAVDFKGSYAVIKKGNLFGVINKSGNEIIPPIWNAIQVLSDTLLGVRKDSLWAVIDYTGKQYLPPVCELLQPAFGGCVLYKVERRTGLLDKNGAKLIPPIFDTIYQYRNNYFETILNIHKGLYSPIGKKILPANNEAIYQYYAGYIVFKTDGKWGAVDMEGTELIHPEWAEMDVISKKFIKVRNNKLWECYSVASKSLSNGAFDEIAPLTENLVLIQKYGAWGIMDANVEIKLKPEYNDIELIHPDVYLLTRGNKYGLASSSTGKLVMPAYADEINSLYDVNVFVYKKIGKYGLVNTSGKQITNPEYELIHLHRNFAKGYKISGGPVTLLNFDSQGNLFEAQEYANLSTIKIGYGTYNYDANTTIPSDLKLEKFIWFYSAKAKKWGLKTIEGDSIVIPPTFKSITVKPLLNVTVVEVKSPSHSINVGLMTYSSNSYFGLINNLTGKYLVGPYYYAFRLPDMDNDSIGNSFAALVEGGMVLINPRTGKTSKPCFFIDKTNTDQARIIKSAHFKVVKKSGEQTLCSAFDYLTSFNVNWFDANGYTISRMNISENYLTSSKAIWGYITKDLEQHLCDKPIDYLENFKGDYAQFKRGKFWGVYDKSFAEIISPIYDDVTLMDLSEGLFKIKKESTRFGFVNNKGNIVVDVSYSNVKSWSENRFLVQGKNGKWGFVNELGKFVIQPIFDDAKSFSEGFAAVKRKGKWGYINTEGTYTIKAAFEAAEFFSEGKAAVKTKGRYGYVDTDGKRIIAPIYSQALPFNEGVAVVMQNSKYGLINETGVWIKKPFCKVIRRDEATGNYIAKKRRKENLYNSDGILVCKGKYNYIGTFNEGLAIVKCKNKFGYIDETGKLIIPATFNFASPFKNGLAKVKTNNLYGYIDLSGEIAIKDSYKRCSDFNNSTALVWEGDKAGLIDNNGKWLVKPRFNVQSGYSEGKAIVRNANGKLCYIDEKGNALFMKEYNNAKPFNDGVAWIMTDKKWELIDNSGEIISLFQYDRVSNFKDGISTVSANSFYGLSKPGDKFMLEAQCEDIQLVKKGLYRVIIGDKLGYFKSDENWLWEARK